MKFTCLQENFAKGLSVVNKAISSKNSLPVLSNVLIASDNGRLKLCATNLETTITTYIGASIDEEGSVTIPARTIYEFVSNLDMGSITGELDGHALKLSSDKASSKFIGIDASEFPEVPIAPESFDLQIDTKIFSEAVLETSFAAAVDETRPVLTGVLMTASGNSLTLVAVDGFRLSEKTISLKEKISESFSCVIPARTLAETARLLTSLKEDVSISLSAEANLILFKCGDIVVSSRVIEGEFPDYKRLIPAEEALVTHVTFKSKDFEKALKLANVFAKDSTNVVKLKVTGDEEVLYVNASSAELGENSSKVSSEIEGRDIEIAFNSKYILDVLSNVKAESFVFSFQEKVGPGTAGVLKVAGNNSYTALIMPLLV